MERLFAMIIADDGRAFLTASRAILLHIFACLLALDHVRPHLWVSIQLACSLGNAFILTFALVLVIGRANVSRYSFENFCSFS
jgi:hypothetical protein